MSIFKQRRTVAFRLVAGALVGAFLFDVLPATAFADLSVPTVIPIAEWRAAIRKEMRIELLCVLIPDPREQAPRERPRRVAPGAPRQLSVSSRVAPFTRRTPDGLYHCVEDQRRLRQVGWDGESALVAPYQAMASSVPLRLIRSATHPSKREPADVNEALSWLERLPHAPVSRKHFQTFSKGKGNEETVARRFIVGKREADGRLHEVKDWNLDDWDLAEGAPEGDGLLISDEFLPLRVPEGIGELALNDVRREQGGLSPKGEIKERASPIREFLFGVPLDGDGGVENDAQELGARPALLSNGGTYVHNSVITSNSLADPSERSEYPVGARVSGGFGLVASSGKGVEIRLERGDLIWREGLDSLDYFSFAHEGLLGKADTTTALNLRKKAAFVAVVFVVPTLNPSQVANGPRGRGSWHVGGGPRSFVAQARLARSLDPTSVSRPRWCACLPRLRLPRT